MAHTVLKVVHKRSRVSCNPRSSSPSAEFFLSENGEFWCILSGILCDLELQKSKQETRYRPGKSKGAGSPTRATHFKPWAHKKAYDLHFLPHLLFSATSSIVYLRHQFKTPLQ